MIGKISSYVAILAAFLPIVNASSCTTSEECERMFGAGSECNEEKVCTNPFFKGGCLHRELEDFNKIRVCNSDDPSDAEENQICRKPDFEDYMELRIYAPEWETRVYISWILQILLSEYLGVPTTIESGIPGNLLSFYDTKMDVDYGTNGQYPSMTLANELGDCRLADKSEENYEKCAHFAPEVWDSDLPRVVEMVNDGILEPAQPLGLNGAEFWAITKFTVENDTTLSSYLGLQGEENRRKLAETFLRPMKWKEYCDKWSPNNCTSDDGVAKRAPRDESEFDRMFVDQLYTGHFRATEENNCDENNSTCTGHFADYPCTWSSFVEQTAYHLDIAVASSGDSSGNHGYTYQQLIDIWRAANATKSNVMTYWWSPDSLYQEFLGTDAEFHKVILPPTTQECLDAREQTVADLCSENKLDRVGDRKGACEYKTKQVTKMINKGLFETIYDSSIPEALHSPVYETLQRFQISEYHVGELFDYTRNSTSAREGICKWAADNFDIAHLKNFAPASYPRIPKDEEYGVYKYVTTTLGGAATLLVLLTMWTLYLRRSRRSVKFAQIEFLWILLVGSLMIAIGAIVTGLPATDGTCIAHIWLINIGYTLELVPLMSKIAAINRLMASAQRMRRVHLKRNTLFGAVFLISLIMVIFLCLWSAIDPPMKTPEFRLTDDQTDEGEFIVGITYSCEGDSGSWEFAAVGWNAVLLLISSALAFQSRSIRSEFNESRTLAFMIYSHFIFVILRSSTFFLSSKIERTLLQQCRSLIFSLDTTTTIFIYFLPKLVGKDEGSTFRTISGLSLPSRSNVNLAQPHGGEREVPFTTGQKAEKEIALSYPRPHIPQKNEESFTHRSATSKSKDNHGIEDDKPKEMDTDDVINI